LGDVTRAKISNIQTPEIGFDKVSAFDIIKIMASYVKAMPRLGGNNYTTLEFDYIDPEDTEIFEITDYIDKEIQTMLENYNTSLEINADNVIASNVDIIKVEPYEGGWLSVRGNTDGPIQLTDENSAVQLTQNIYRITKFEIKGIEVTTNNRTLPASTVWDLTDYIREKKEYDGFDPQLDRTNAGILTQGNSFYYSQGDNKILNIGYTSPTDPALYTTTERALFEALYDKVLNEYPTDTISNYNQNASNHEKFYNVFFRISYIPMSSVRALLKKYNFSDYEYEVETYINESARLIDSFTIGEYTRETLNRSGNDTINYTGIIRDLELLPDIGYKDLDGNIISSYSINVVSPEIKLYTLQLQNNFSGVNPIIQIPSAYRQYQIPDDDVVFRQDIYYETFIFSKDDIGDYRTIYGYPTIREYFLKPFLDPSITVYPTFMKPVAQARIDIRNEYAIPSDSG
jgi:hypothetical protein